MVRGNDVAASSRKRRLMGEINVVPYIDVMLVLLIIFMVTAPLIAQGVKVDLPEADAEILKIDKNNPEPVVLTINRAGEMLLSHGSSEGPMTEKEISANVSAILRQRPEQVFLVRGDRNIAYGKVVEAMVILQQAGVPEVGLVTYPPEKEEGAR